MLAQTEDRRSPHALIEGGSPSSKEQTLLLSASQNWRDVKELLGTAQRAVSHSEIPHSCFREPEFISEPKIFQQLVCNVTFYLCLTTDNLVKLLEDLTI